jgi:hypothetical protein
MFYHSKTLPGVGMNRYGVVWLPVAGRLKISGRRVRDAVWREAAKDGYTLSPGDNPDVGNVWHKPAEKGKS